MNNHTIDESWFIKPIGVPEKVTAGGVVARVENDQVKIAVIEKEFRGGIRFSLPKGHVEVGETIEETAVREIYEETGINDLQFVQFLKATERLNSKKSAWKVNHFYLFITEQINCTPLEDDKVVRWFPIDNLPQMFWSDQSQLLREHRQEIVSKVL
ncbi:MAG: NUDIX domain-containing protein [Acidobacteriota bacterium]